AAGQASRITCTPTPRIIPAARSTSSSTATTSTMTAPGCGSSSGELLDLRDLRVAVDEDEIVADHRRRRALVTGLERLHRRPRTEAAVGAHVRSDHVDGRGIAERRTVLATEHVDVAVRRCRGGVVPARHR